MGTKAGRKTTTTATDVPQGYFPAFDARSRLITTTVNMGWRMAIMIVIPIIIGLKLDERFGTKPSYVLTGFFLAIGGCAYMIYNEYTAINAESALLFPDTKKSKRVPKTTVKRKKEV
jgi:hypothetical protein